MAFDIQNTNDILPAILGFVAVSEAFVAAFILGPRFAMLGDRNLKGSKIVRLLYLASLMMIAGAVYVYTQRPF